MLLNVSFVEHQIYKHFSLSFGKILACVAFLLMCLLFSVTQSLRCFSLFQVHKMECSCSHVTHSLLGKVVSYLKYYIVLKVAELSSY